MKIKIRKCIILNTLLLILFFSCVRSAEAKNLYVNNSGSPACSDATTYINNDANNPWCNLLRAVRGNADGNRNTAGVSAQAAQAGDVVLVTGGTYNYSGAYWSGEGWTSVLYNPINSGTAGSWITFQAVGTVNLTADSLVLGQAGASRSATIGAMGSQYIVWDGFTLNEANAPWRQAMVNVIANNVTVRNCTIIGQYRSLGGDNHAGIITHYGSVTAGVCDGAVSNVTIHNNRVYGFTGDSNRNDAGIKLYCVGDNVTLSNNEIYLNNAGIQNKTQRGPEINVVIRNNYIHDNNLDGIVIQSPTNWDIYQNIIVNNLQNFHMMNTQYYYDFPVTRQPHHIRFVNNTCHNNHYAVGIEGFCPNMHDNFVQNNLFTGDSVFGISSEGVDCQTPQYVGPDEISFDYNDYNHSGHFYANDGNGLVATFTSWQSTWGQDGHSITNADPMYVDEANRNFRLQGDSPALTLGVDILDLDNDGLTTDTIPAGAYITGSECIGLTENCNGDTTPPVSPSGLSVS